MWVVRGLRDVAFDAAELRKLASGDLAGWSRSICGAVLLRIVSMLPISAAAFDIRPLLALSAQECRRGTSSAGLLLLLAAPGRLSSPAHRSRALVWLRRCRPWYCFAGCVVVKVAVQLNEGPAETARDGTYAYVERVMSCGAGLPSACSLYASCVRRVCSTSGSRRHPHKSRPHIRLRSNLQHGRAGNYTGRHPVGRLAYVLYAHADLQQEHLRAQRLLRRASRLAMRADQDDGAQGGRGKRSAALPRCTERRAQLHPDHDCHQYVLHCIAYALHGSS